MTETNFKHTDLGPIPHDWEVKTIKEIATLINGRAYRQDELLPEGKYKVLRVGNFFTNDSWYYSNLELEDKLYCHKGDLLYAWSCTFGAYIWNEDNTIFHYHIWRVECNNVAKKYLYYLLNDDVEKQKSASQGSTMTHITKGYLEQRSFPIPPTIAEQERIAGALSSIDTLIGALTEQIEKKRHIKQGTMQQLLTGKKRLEGFTGAWKSVKLDDLLAYEQPTRYLVQSTEYTEQGTPVLTAGKTFILGYTTEGCGIFDKLPVIIFDDFVVESKYVTFPFKVKSSAMKMLSLRDKANNLRFIYEKMQYIDFPIADHKRHWISEYSQIEITLPEPAEQSAIAAVLYRMDTEIAALEQKRDKYIAIKSGMMQNLLTGKIRLV